MTYSITVVVPPMAAAAVPVSKSSLARDGAEREVQVGVGVDAAGDDERPAASTTSSPGSGDEAGADLGDAPVGAEAHVGQALAVDVDEGPARYEHVNNSSAEVDSLLKAVVSRTS